MITDATEAKNPDKKSKIRMIFCATWKTYKQRIFHGKASK